MKYVIMHGDGMADWPCKELGERTPLEAARKPNMDLIASCGQLGMVTTIPKGMPAGSDVGTMTMLGYDPLRYHTGRAPIEAASQGIELEPTDVVFRMNLVNIGGAGESADLFRDGTMEDFTAGHISSQEAAELVADLQRKLGGDDIRFYNGVSYRHIMVWKNGPTTTTLTPPHDITGKPVSSHLPSGEGADRLLSLTRAAAEILGNHQVNRRRQDAGKPRATSVWFWGQGRRPMVPTLNQRFGVSGAVISAVDLVNGLGRLAGLRVVKVPGATGFLDTDYAAKGRWGLEALKECDFLLLHVEAPDEAGHMGRSDLKVEALERIDELVLGQMIPGLDQFGAWRLLLMPDHATPSTLKTHSNEPVPFAMVSSGDLKSGKAAKRRYTEAEGKGTGLAVEQGYQLIERLLAEHPARSS